MPSLVISTQSAFIPEEWATGRASIAVIVPDVGAWMAAEIVPAGSAIFCPLSTLSPTVTQAIAGAPICWPKGTTNFSGIGKLPMG